MYSLRKSLERKRQKTRVEVPTLTHVIKVRDASILQASVTLSYILHKAKVVPRNHFGMVYIMLWKSEMMANLEIEGSPKSNHLLFLYMSSHSLWTRKASQLIQVGVHLVQPTTNSYTQVHHFLHQDKGSTSMVDGQKYSICIDSIIIYTFKSNAFSIGISTSTICHRQQIPRSQSSTKGNFDLGNLLQLSHSPISSGWPHFCWSWRMKMCGCWRQMAPQRLRMFTCTSLYLETNKKHAKQKQCNIKWKYVRIPISGMFRNRKIIRTIRE